MTLVEVCLEDVGGAATAAAAGAEAIEVCAGLADGGTTPTLGFVLHCIEAAPDLDIELAMETIIALYGFNYMRVADGADAKALTDLIDRQLRLMFAGLGAGGAVNPSL